MVSFTREQNIICSQPFDSLGVPGFDIPRLYRGQCDISGTYSPALFRTLLRKRGEREGTKVTRLICIQRVFNRRYWAMGMSRPLFVGKEREGYNLVHRVFVPYCAC